MSDVPAPATMHRAYRLGILGAAAALFAVVSAATAGYGSGGGDAGATGAQGGPTAVTGGGDNGSGGSVSGAQGANGSAVSAGGAAGGASAGTAGGSAGASSGAGAASAGGAGTAGSTTRAVNDQGVSSRAISVGFVYVPDSFYTHFGVAPQHEDDIINSYVKYVNAHGGVNGRALSAVLVPDGDDTTATAGDAACRSAVNDSHVFMVVDQGQIGVSDCVVRLKRPLITYGTSSFVTISAGQIAGGSPYLWTIAPPLETQVQQWVQWLAHVKKAQSDKIGIIYTDVDYGRLAKQVFESDAPQYGINVVSDFPFSIDPSQVGAECPNVANDFRTKGVTKVAFIAGAEGAGVFANCLQTQGLSVTYTFSSIGGPTRTDYGDFFPSSYVGSDGTSFEHSSNATNAAQQVCNAALTSNETAGEGYGTIAEQYCEMIFLTWKVLGQIPASSGYNVSTFASSIASVTNFPANDTDTLSFSPSNHSGSATSLVLKYVSHQTFQEQSGFQRAF